jgi:low affinity Fe/Cu permease
MEIITYVFLGAILVLCMTVMLPTRPGWKKYFPKRLVQYREIAELQNQIDELKRELEELKQK